MHLGRLAHMPTSSPACLPLLWHPAGVPAVRLIKTIRKKNPEVQLLLFSATFNDRVKEFAIRIAPNANQVRYSRGSASKAQPTAQGSGSKYNPSPEP